MAERRLHEQERRRAFFALVQMQDQGATVEESRSRVAAEFGVEHEEVRGIEREGIAHEWPPL